MTTEKTEKQRRTEAADLAQTLLGGAVPSSVLVSRRHVAQAVAEWSRESPDPWMGEPFTAEEWADLEEAGDSEEEW